MPVSTRHWRRSRSPPANRRSQLEQTVWGALSAAQPHPSRSLRSLSAIAALLLFTLLVSALFGALRSRPDPAAESMPTPTVHRPFMPYTAAAPGIPCDQNPQAQKLFGQEIAANALPLLHARGWSRRDICLR